MALKFEVVDVRGEGITASVHVDGASTPEEAARRALGIEVVRSGRPKDLVARVYWQHVGSSARNMVRLYAKVAT